MSALTFDTLKFSHRLEQAGLPRAQAEAQAQALAEVFEANLQELATKGDLREVEAKLIGESVDLRKDMELRFAQIDGKFVLLQWMLGLLLGGVAALVGKSFF